MEIAAHAKRENRSAILASWRKVPTFSTTSKSKTLLIFKKMWLILPITNRKDNTNFLIKV